MFLQFYLLHEQPFGVTPDARFLFETGVCREALASLQYGLEAGRGFLGLIAPPGMGKTTLLFHLLEQLRDRTRTAFLFHTQCDSREFLRSLLAELECEPGATRKARDGAAAAMDNSGFEYYLRVAEQARQIANADGAAVALVENGHLMCKASVGRAPAAGVRLQPDTGLSGECFRTRRVIYCEDTQQDARVPKPLAEGAQLRSVVIVPITNNGQTLGLLEVMSSQPGAFQANDIAELAKVSESLSSAARFGAIAGDDEDRKPEARADMVELQQALQEILLREARAGAPPPVVAIDEAQNLSDSVLETVRLLSNFETPRSKLLQIIMAGQPELAERLASPGLAQLRQRVSMLARLAPLEPSEIGHYIEHRMRVAGYLGTPLFTPEANAMVARLSGGIPRNINNICFNALSLGCALGRRKIDTEILREVEKDLNWGTLAEGGENAAVPLGELASASTSVATPVAVVTEVRHPAGPAKDCETAPTAAPAPADNGSRSWPAPRTAVAQNAVVAVPPPRKDDAVEKLRRAAEDRASHNQRPNAPLISYWRLTKMAVGGALLVLFLAAFALVAWKPAVHLWNTGLTQIAAAAQQQAGDRTPRPEPARDAREPQKPHPANKSRARRSVAVEKPLGPRGQSRIATNNGPEESAAASIGPTHMAITVTPAAAETDSSAKEPVAPPSESRTTPPETSAPAPKAPPPDGAGQVTHMVEPQYPAAAQEQHVEGQVLLNAFVDQAGRVTAVHALAGNPLLVGAAMNALKQWRFAPSYIDGQPSAVQKQVAVNFKLR